MNVYFSAYHLHQLWLRKFVLSYKDTIITYVCRMSHARVARPVKRAPVDPLCASG